MIAEFLLAAVACSLLMYVATCADARRETRALRPGSWHHHKPRHLPCYPTTCPCDINDIIIAKEMKCIEGNPVAKGDTFAVKMMFLDRTHNWRIQARGAGGKTICFSGHALKYFARLNGITAA